MAKRPTDALVSHTMFRLNKSTTLALCAMTEIAAAGGESLSVTALAETFGVPTNHLAKVVQQLVRAGLLVATRGAAGGNRLARDPKNITLADIVEIFEGERRPLAADVFGVAAAGTPPGVAGGALGAVFSEIDEQVFFTLKSVSLKTLVRRVPRKL